jgi:CheY-like chemotaxis protein
MSRLQAIRFYLIDDNDIDLSVNSKLLQIADISPNIHTYSRALAFLEDIRSREQDFTNGDHVLLLDIMMPRMNGFECLDELEKLPVEIKSHLTVFMLSSTIDRNDIRRAESYGLVQRLLEKPLDIYLLKKALENLFL